MKLLIVDDQEHFARMLARIVRRLGHLAVVADHPEDALRLFMRHDFDAVITDIDMPAMSGVEFACRCIDFRPEIPIAFCTGSSPTDENVQQASAIGIVMPKLFQIEEVASLLLELGLGFRVLASSAPVQHAS